MELLIVRHAIALERDTNRWPDDEERPLSARGLARARKAALGLKALSAAPGRVLTSPLLRAAQTAAILAQVAGWPKPVACRQLMPGIAPSTATPTKQAIDNQNSHRWMRQMRRRSPTSISPIAEAITTAARAGVGRWRSKPGQ